MAYNLKDSSSIEARVEENNIEFRTKWNSTNNKLGKSEITIPECDEFFITTIHSNEAILESIHIFKDQITKELSVSNNSYYKSDSDNLTIIYKIDKEKIVLNTFIHNGKDLSATAGTKIYYR